MSEPCTAPRPKSRGGANPVEVDLSRGRFRRIYGELLRDPAFNALSQPAELLYYRLLLIADDFGNFELDAELIRCAAFARRPGFRRAALASALTELCDMGMVLRYPSESPAYGHINGFTALQPRNKNGKRFRYFPPCPGEQQDGEVSPGDSGCGQVNPGESGCDAVNPGVPETDAEAEGEAEVRSEGRGRARENTGAGIARAIAPDAGSVVGSDAGPEAGTRMGQTDLGFVNLGLVRLAEAFGFTPDEYRRQKRPLAAVLNRIAKRINRVQLVDELVAMAKEKRSDKTLEYPVKAWQAAVSAREEYTACT